MGTAEKKQAFLDNYATFDGIMAVCEAIDINYSTYWRWMQGDEVFSKQCTALKKEVDSKRLDRYEKELDNRALGGTSKQSDILLMFGLKALKPGVYREQVSTHPLIGDIKIVMAIPGYDESLRLGKDENLHLTNTIDLKEGDYAIQGQGDTEEGSQRSSKEA